MDGSKDFHKTQLGPEVKNGGDAGTAVAATYLWRGMMVGSDDTGRNYPDEGLGRMINSTRTLTPVVKGSLKQGPDALTFEQFILILNGAIRAKKAGIKDGAGSGYVWSYPLAMQKSDLILTGTTISFALTGKKIQDSGNGLAFVKTGDIIRVSGSGSNNGVFTVATGNVAGEIVVNETIANESAGATVTIEVCTQTYTIEDGNNRLVKRSAYCFPIDFEISGQGGSDADFYKLSSNWYARQWAELTAGFTTLSPTVQSPVYFGNTKMYIDAVGGTIGTTEKPNTLASAKLKVVDGLTRKFSGNGYTYFGSQGRKAASIECELQFWHNDVAEAEMAYALAGTSRLIRLLIEGPTLASAGTSYSKKTIIVDLPGVFEPVKSPQDIDGMDIFGMVFKSGWDETANLGPSITVVNELSTI